MRQSGTSKSNCHRRFSDCAGAGSAYVFHRGKFLFATLRRMNLAWRSQRLFIQSHTMKSIAVLGPGTCNEATAAFAREVGRLLAQHGVTLICGGRGGVMEAACRGAKEAGGVTIGILPGESAAEANPFVTIPIVTGLGEARNLIIVRSARAVIAVGGEYGTLSEIAFALKFGVPIIGLRSWRLARGDVPDRMIIETETPEAAVAAALQAMTS
jgi:uncharacterized protein (TIGR00725 family)